MPSSDTQFGAPNGNPRGTPSQIKIARTNAIKAQLLRERELDIHTRLLDVHSNDKLSTRERNSETKRLVAMLEVCADLRDRSIDKTLKFLNDSGIGPEPDASEPQTDRTPPTTSIVIKGVSVEDADE